MKYYGLDMLFLSELEEIYNAEIKTFKSLTHIIHHASLPHLKEALRKHLKETKSQIRRLERIFNILEIAPKQKRCKAIEGLLKEASVAIQNKTKSYSLDAAIISAIQKIEHFEIATYGTLRSFAKHLNLNDEIIDLLKETLNEEGAADRKLTKIAEGTIFSRGINQEATRKKAA